MKSISILGCGWLGLPLGKHLASLGFLVKGSTTRKAKLVDLEAAGILPFHLNFDPDPKGDCEGFFSSDILIVNLPPRNKDGIPDFHQSQLKEIVKAAQSRVENILFISSTAVYPANNQLVTEADAETSCLTRGGIPLLDMENLFVKNGHFKTTVMRFGGLYGPDRHPGKFLAGKKNVAGADNPVNMIHLDDCIGIISRILEQDIWGDVFNASAPSEETRKSFYQRAAKALNVEPPEFNSEPSPFKKVSSARLIEKTGYQFRY